MAERIGDYMAQVDEVAGLKTAGDARHFGETAVSLGFITPATVEASMASQK